MIDVVMPQMGESIVEGTLTKWLKKPGERVERDEPLFEISTDKVDTEIPAPSSGVLQEVLVEEGKTVGINTVVGRIAEEGGAAAPAEPAAAQPPAAPQPPPAQPPAAQPAPPPPPPAQAAAPAQPANRRRTGAAEEQQQQGPLSPVVRKIARERNIDLSQVKGTGAGGRITKADVEAFAQPQAAQAPAAPQAQQPHSGAGPSCTQPRRQCREANRRKHASSP